VYRLIANHLVSIPSRTPRSEGPSLHRHCPASAVLWPSPSPSQAAPLAESVGARLRPDWGSPTRPDHLPRMPCSLPRWTRPVQASVTSRSVQPSPFLRRVGVHDFTFEACSSFTRVTAYRVAQPPMVAFVTRLRPGPLPAQAACQLPDLTTIIWVGLPPTGDLRRWGALRKAGRREPTLKSRTPERRSADRKGKFTDRKLHRYHPPSASAAADRKTIPCRLHPRRIPNKETRQGRGEKITLIACFKADHGGESPSLLGGGYLAARRLFHQVTFTPSYSGVANRILYR
jgi:hypothetical protein